MPIFTNKPETMSHVAWFRYARSRANDWFDTLSKNPRCTVSATMIAAWERQVMLAFTHMTKSERESL